MWEIYNDLIDAVPRQYTVAECLAGLSWFLVRSAGVGVAMRPRDGDGPVRSAGTLAGLKLHELAAWIKSWNYYEAAMGLAAINSALNAPVIARQNCGDLLKPSEDQNLFDAMINEFRGKKVAVIGHFMGVEKLGDKCQLSILERIPRNGDLPDPACEYVLREQDFVIMTATTLINKTMPRLLQLSRGARVMVAGPSTPLHPLMFEHGVSVLGGLLVHDEPRVWKAIAEGGHRELFTSGSGMVKVYREKVVESRN